jgi:LPS sulfotransferase NodH/glycosyltransferase involved in cell wall biosynthesis
MYYNNTEECDFPEIEAVKKSYLICSVPRSGSTLLCRGLWDSGFAGAPKEYFHHKHMQDFYARWDPKTTLEYIRFLKQYRTSPNGIFGFKAHFDQFDKIRNEFDVNTALPGLKYIFVLRADHLRQAISLSKAMQTKQRSSDDSVERDPVYDYQDILQKKEWIIKQEEQWRSFFSQSNVQPFEVVYEKFVNEYEKTIRDVFDFIEINLPPGYGISAPQLTKMSDETNEIWHENFLKDNIVQHSFGTHKSSEFKTKSPSVHANDLPKISVEMGCYNFENYIAEAIESVLSQTLRPYEIIISDDHSTDRSWMIIESYQNKYPDLIRAFRTPENIGMKKCGILRKDMIRGDLFSTIDGDDRWLPRKLELEWEALKRNPEAKLAYSNVYLIDESGEKIGICYDGSGDPPPSGDVFVQTFAKRFFKTNRSVFRSHLMYYDVLKEIGFKDLDENLMHPDWDKKIRMTAKYKVAYSGHALVEYRSHNNGIHKSQAKDLFKSTNYVIQKNIHLLQDRSPAEQQFVLENLKTLLVQDYTYGQKFAGKNDERRKGDCSRIIQCGNDKGANLIFLISQPRAGSTLVQRILGGHPDVHTTAEPWIMLHPLYALKEKGAFAEFDSNLAKQGLEDFTSQVPEGIDLYIAALRQFGCTLYNRVLEISGKKIFLDKTPRYYFIIPELKKVFPQAKFIILLRNPMAVLSSTLKTWFHNDPESLKASPNYKDVMQGPQYLIEGIRFLKEDAIVVRYEELVEDTEMTIKAICHKLGIAFQHEMLAYGGRPKPKGRFGDVIGIVKHDNAVPYYIDKWITNLKSAELYEFSLNYIKALGPDIFDVMGYPYHENKNKLEGSENPTCHKENQTDNASQKQIVSSKNPQTVEDRIKILETNLENNPHSAQSHNDLGVLYYQSGLKEKVLNHYQEAVRLNPHNTVFLKNLADFYYVELKNVIEALQIYNDILEIEPKDAETLQILGFICEDLQKYEDAKDFYTQVLAIEPHNHQARHRLDKLGTDDSGDRISAKMQSRSTLNTRPNQQIRT